MKFKIQNLYEQAGAQLVQLHLDYECPGATIEKPISGNYDFAILRSNSVIGGIEVKSGINEELERRRAEVRKGGSFEAESLGFFDVFLTISRQSPNSLRRKSFSKLVNEINQILNLANAPYPPSEAEVGVAISGALPDFCSLSCIKANHDKPHIRLDVEGVGALVPHEPSELIQEWIEHSEETFMDRAGIEEMQVAPFSQKHLVFWLGDNACEALQLYFTEDPWPFEGLEVTLPSGITNFWIAYHGFELGGYRAWMLDAKHGWQKYSTVGIN